MQDELKLEWRSGPPEKPYSEEWFIAKTVYGDRVVLKALPEEYTYDFTTADETYMLAKNVAKWMQFPDSEFIEPTSPPPQPVAGLVEEFTATIKFAAHEWWRRQGMSGTAEEVEIGRDGRVTVRWKDADESGRYGLPVDFLQALTAPAPDVTDAMVELVREGVEWARDQHDEGCELHDEFGKQNLESANDVAIEEDIDAVVRDWPDGAECTCEVKDYIARCKAALAAQSKPDQQPEQDVVEAAKTCLADVLEGHAENDSNLCCSGDMCNCEGASVFKSVQHYFDQNIAAALTDAQSVREAVLAEREACAEVAESWMKNSALAGDMATYAAHQTGGDIAKAIRALAAQDGST